MTFARHLGSWHTLRLLTVLALVGAATLACDDDGTQPEPTATFQFSGTVTGFAGLALGNARISVADGTGGVVATTTTPLVAGPAPTPGPAAQVVGPASFDASLEVEGAGPFTYLIELLDGGSVVMYESPSGTLEGGIDQQIAVTEFSFVGPGADVVTVEVDIDGPATLRVGEEFTAEAYLLDGAGNDVLGVPVHWSVANGEVELIEAYSEGGYAYADFRALTATAAESIEVATPAGVDGSTTVEVVEPVFDNVVLDVTVPRFPGLEPTAARVELTGDVAKDTTVELTYPAVVEPTTVALELVIPVDVTFDDSYTVDLMLVEGETDLYSATAIAATGNGVGVAVDLDYVGPGVDASTVEITLASPEAVVGESTLATATAKDAGGTVITGVPFAWTLANPGLEGDPVELRQGLAEIGITGGLTAGTYDVTAETPTGVSATVTFTLTQAPGADPVTIDFLTYPDGTTTSIGPLGNEYAEWGAIFRFAPSSSVQTTGMPHLAKDSPGTTAWIENGKTTYGSTTVGFIITEFTTPVTSIQTSVYAPGQTWVRSDRYIVFDTSGAVVTSGITFGGGSFSDTIEYEGGISKISIRTGNGVIRVLEITYN